MSKPRELSISIGNKTIYIEGDLPGVNSDTSYVEKSAADELYAVLEKFRGIPSVDEALKKFKGTE